MSKKIITRLTKYYFCNKPYFQYEIKPMVVRETTTVEKGFLAKMKKTGRRLVVFYGSQTGTAEEFAGRLAKEGAR